MSMKIVKDSFSPVVGKPEKVNPLSGKIMPAVPGLTLLDFFAASALLGLNRRVDLTGQDSVAAMAYAQANAMMAEREKWLKLFKSEQAD